MKALIWIILVAGIAIAIRSCGSDDKPGASSAPPSAASQSVDNAYRLCAVLDKTRLLSEPCSVSGWKSSVDIKIDTTGVEALKICDGMVRMVREQGITFAPGWRIRIYSPYTGENTLAQCSL